MDMKIFITGAYGQLGSELLKQSKYEIIGSDIDTVDVTNSEQIESFVVSAKPDVIINCASITNVDLCESEQEKAFSVNAIGAKKLALAAEKLGAILVQLSSDYVFDGKSNIPYKETDITNPLNIYGKAKVVSEEYVRATCKRHFIVRTAWLYGLAGDNFVKTILNAARQGEPLKVVNDQIGNPTNAADLAKHLLILVNTEEYGTYHCTNNGECSRYEFACEFLRLSGLEYTIKPCATDEFPRFARRPEYSSLDNMMLRLTAADKMRHWRDAIADYMTHYNKETGAFSL
jgi:dTDP-4-dehydrorhamnose reductase